MAAPEPPLPDPSVTPVADHAGKPETAAGVRMVRFSLRQSGSCRAGFRFSISDYLFDIPSRFRAVLPLLAATLMIPKISLRIILVNFFGCLLLATATAAPIDGHITFGGSVQFDTNNVNTANAVTSWFNTHVESADGDFSSIASNAPVAFTAPWTFDPSTATPSLWSVGGFKFDLFTSTIIFQGNGFLNISGSGLVSSTNSAFDPTPGNWAFSAQSPSAGGKFSFSAAEEVPEPSTVTALLVGSMIFGGAIWRLRRRMGKARARQPIA